MIAFCDRLQQNGLSRCGARCQCPAIMDETRAIRLSCHQRGDKAMAGRREDVDLHLVLRDPKCAREYIAHFDWSPLEAPPYVVSGVDKKICLKNMTDDEAVEAAIIILHDVEIQKALRTKQYEKWDQ